jgi:hypothetical protein
VRLCPSSDLSECLGLGFRGVIRDQKYIAVQFTEFSRVISSEVDEKQFTGLFRRRSRCQLDMVAVGVFDSTPAIKMQAFWRSPPLAPQVVMAILRRFAD